MVEIVWSDWLDFSAEIIATIPESPGVFMTHAAMKILYIGDTENLREAVSKSQKEPCSCDAKRLRYCVLSSHKEAAEQLLTEYREKHDGKMPMCM